MAWAVIGPGRAARRGPSGPAYGQFRGAVSPWRRGDEPLMPRRDMARPYPSAHGAEPIPAGSANPPRRAGKSGAGPAEPARHLLSALRSRGQHTVCTLRFDKRRENWRNQHIFSVGHCTTLSLSLNYRTEINRSSRLHCLTTCNAGRVKLSKTHFRNPHQPPC